MNILKFLTINFSALLQKHGLVSFVLIFVFMVRSVMYDSIEQQQNSAQVLILGGFIILFVVLAELGLKTYKEFFGNSKTAKPES